MNGTQNGTYLRVGNGNNPAVFNDTGNRPIPSQIVPGIEYIKNAQRSLGGKLHVDVSDSKQTLQIIFDVLTQDEFVEVKEVFGTDRPEEEGIKVEYANVTIDDEDARYFVDDFTFNPMILDDGIRWKDVTVSLVEV